MARGAKGWGVTRAGEASEYPARRRRPCGGPAIPPGSRIHAARPLPGGQGINSPMGGRGIGMAGTLVCKNGHGRLERDPLRQVRVCGECGYAVSDEDVLRGVAEAGYGIVSDGVADGMLARAPAAQAGRMTLGAYVQRDLSHGGSGAAAMAAAQVLGGPSLADTLGFYVVPQAPAWGGDPRTELVGTLVKFIAYLKRNGILDDVEAPGGHHRLHKYAYIAKGLGMRLGYDFDFLENGAFSSDMEVDLFGLDVARGGMEPFAGDAGASREFLGLVRGRGAEWLQVATFAMRDRGRKGALDGFLRRRHGVIKYEKGTVRSAFEAVGRCARGAAWGAS